MPTLFDNFITAIGRGGGPTLIGLPAEPPGLPALVLLVVAALAALAISAGLAAV